MRPTTTPPGPRRASRARRLAAAACFLAATAATAGLPAQVEFGLAVGASTYEGDLAPARFADNVGGARASYGAFVRVPATPYGAVRVYAHHSEIHGDDRKRVTTTERNLSFASEVDELGLLLEAYPLGRAYRVKPYAYAGASVYRFGPVAEYEGRTVELQPLGTEGQLLAGGPGAYALTRLAVPLGVGASGRVAGRWSLGVEVSARLTFFDYLDDVSDRYADPDALMAAAGPDAAALADRGPELEAGGAPAPVGSLRGDPDDNDWWYVGSVTLSYALAPGRIRAALARKPAHERCYRFEK